VTRCVEPRHHLFCALANVFYGEVRAMPDNLHIKTPLLEVVASGWLAILAVLLLAAGFFAGRYMNLW
jgi:hypothetical protein